jgi:peroxiredoxin
MAILTPGKNAPRFNLTSLTGDRRNLQEALASGPILLAFFKVACPTCQFTFPFLQRLYTQLSNQNGQVWGIVQDNAADARTFAEALGVTFPVLIDEPPYNVSNAYGLEHVPSLFLVDSDGRIEVSGDGFAKSDIVAIHASLARQLAATPPPLFLATERIPEFKPG